MSWRIAVLLLAGVLSFPVSGCAGRDTTDQPPIVEVFACSDYCPGPKEKYLKNVYDGVDDETTCLELGGKPYTYIGWGTYFICIAD